MAVRLPAAVLERYRRFTLYNSPYTAHDRGCAVDLYPGDATGPDPADGPPVDAPSPVAGEVIRTRTVAGPDRPYAADEDHLLLIDTAVGDGPDWTAGAADGGPHGAVCRTVGDPDGAAGAADGEGVDGADEAAPVARILHVDPAVEAGDRVSVGDSLGRLVRAGFFAPWVANHLHLEFRERGADLLRASGSLPLAPDPELDRRAVEWDGTGTVTATGRAYAVLDAPAHPAPGDCFAGLAVESADGPVILDGGLPHYDRGGLIVAGSGGSCDSSGVGRAGGAGDAGGASVLSGGPVEFLGATVGTATGRDVEWDDVTVLANGRPVRGLALSLARDRLGAKLVGESVALDAGDTVRVTIERG